MKAEDVPEEWAEPVAMALSNAVCKVLYDTDPYTDVAVWRSISGYEMLMDRARSALAAIAPLIAAAERERAAKVAEDKAEGLLQAGEFLPVSHRFSYQLRETDARDIAAAIRTQGATS